MNTFVSHVWVTLDYLTILIYIRGVTFTPKHSRCLSLGGGLILLFACLSSPGATNSVWFTQVWKTDNGLINNNILAVAQGKDGYLWVAPSVGLMHFDGVKFDRFPLEDFTGPIHNHICTMLCSRTGVLWIAMFNGRVFGVKPDFSVITLPRASLPRSTALTLAEDNDESLWIGYLNTVCRVKNGHVTRFDAKNGVPAGIFHSLINDGHGNIWLAKGGQICIFRDGEFQSVTNVQGVRCLAATHTNAIWLVAQDHLFTCNTDGVLQDYGTSRCLYDVKRRALLEDHTGAVWIGTEDDGLFRYSKSGFEKVETSYSGILSLAEDNEGNIWAGTHGGGLNRISLSGVHLETWKNNPNVSQIQSICQDTNGVMWGATYKGMLVSRIHDEWVPVLTNAPFSGIATCVADDCCGGIWIGSQNGKLFHLADNHYTTNQTKIPGIIYSLLPVSSGELWIFGHDMVQRLHNGQLQNVKLPRSLGFITAAAEDANSNIWIGAKGTVLRFNGKKFVDESPYLPISDRTICCIYGTHDGSVWISCGGLGLVQIKENGHVNQIGSTQGLFNDYISQIVVDGHGWLWFGSDHGIFKIQRSELDQVMKNPDIHLRPVVYGRNEGLSGLEALFSSSSPYALPRALRTHDGRIWLLTHSGIVVADPKLLPGSIVPPVLLTRVVMDGRIMASYGGNMSTQSVANLKTLIAPLRLPPGHRHLEFDYTAFHFAAPQNIHFRYQLAGFDDDWIDAESARHADYSRLTAGSYQFRVEACVGDGPWNKTPATLAFIVAPFFWQTWWFRLGVLLLFTSSMIAIVRYVSFRRIQVKMRLLEQRATLDRERTRIARDLHDDLGCSLNKVALTMEMIQRESTPTEAAKIQHCWTMVREAAGSVDEIVWAINPRNDTLHYMVDYISQFAVEFLQAAEISCVMDLPDNFPELTISPEARHNLLLVVKEALNNIVLHAQADNVHVRITTSESHVAIIIEDNGRGFNRAPDNACCDGLRNMRQRMEEIGGQFELDSQPGAGTRVKFLYFWQLNPK